LIAYRNGAFDTFSRWPMVSKIALYAGVPFIGLAIYFSTLPATYSMLIPVGIQAPLSIVAAYSLRRLKTNP